MSRYLLPYLDVQWSNGIFIHDFAVGAHLSRTPNLQYGPLIGIGGDKRRERGEPGEPSGFKPVAGGFASYQVLHNVSFGALAMYGGGRGGDGATLNLRARTWMPLAPHHNAAFELGVNLADRSYMRSHFGETAEGGTKDVFVRASWSWQMSRKYDLRTGISLNRLGGNVAASRFVETRNGANLSTAVLYRF